MVWKDRTYAGERLAKILEPLMPIDGIVVALPRGGVPVAVALAGQLLLPIRLLFIRKIGHPINPEFAIGAVSSESERINPSTQFSRSVIDPIITRERSRIQEMRTRFGYELNASEIKDKTILLVDDGIATGTCITLAIQHLRAHRAQSIWVVVPVCSHRAAQTIRLLADKFICLYEPEQFAGIGSFYLNFEQLTDNQVIQALKAIATR